MTGEDLIGLAAEAYVYGFPLVFDIGEVTRISTDGLGAVAPVGVNRFGHARQMAGPDDTFVSINNDTLYSMASVDLGAGPVALDVPDTGDRYYVLQCVDAWTNNFAYIGRRATGTAAGRYLFVPPRWDGEGPDGRTVVPAPTRVFSIVGRFACDGPDDVPAVAALQARLALTPPAATPAEDFVTRPDDRVGDDLSFWERLRTWLAAFPPPPEEADQVDRYRPLGLLEATSPYVQPDGDLAAVLAKGLAAGKERIETASRQLGERVNGWQVLVHAFDYNAHHLGLGTIDSADWIITDPARAQLTRAVAARVGLWGNHGYEAVYPVVFVDVNGDPLDGERRYRLRFATPPPVDAFWSITMYDASDYYLVANPIDRHSIGDRTPGLVTAEDGSVTIVIQHEPPDDPDARANWLPAPAGPFRPLMRLYQPGAAVLDGTWQPPPIEPIT